MPSLSLSDHLHQREMADSNNKENASSMIPNKTDIDSQCRIRIAKNTFDWTLQHSYWPMDNDDPFLTRIAHRNLDNCVNIHNNKNKKNMSKLQWWASWGFNRWQCRHELGRSPAAVRIVSYSSSIRRGTHPGLENWHFVCETAEIITNSKYDMRCGEKYPFQGPITK